jgi:crotonobetainyl-CoA:carnitine CoA-transferase CaiB-like acyl-CoA transferase
MRPFEGIKIIDCTHVLAGPFAAYQLAVLGADVIKVDDPNEPDQSRESGADHALNKAMMGTGFLTQGSNKRAIALNLKTEGGRARAMFDVAMILQGSHITDFLHSGHHPKRAGNKMRFAASS